MTYRVYIKKDYKPQVRLRKAALADSKVLILATVCAFAFLAYQTFSFLTQFTVETEQPLAINTTDSSDYPYEQENSFISPAITMIPNQASPETSQASMTLMTPQAKRALPESIESLLDSEIIDTTKSEVHVKNGLSEDIPWQSVTVKSGDSLALIFTRLGLSATELYRIMSLGKNVNILKKIKPGQIINFHIENDRLLGIEYEKNLTQTLSISLKGDQYRAELLQHSLNTVVKNADAFIHDSLFLSGKRAGLSDNLIMQLVSIYGWDIDFALDIREGDRFTVIYEEKYKDGLKVADGPILAAEFTNQNTTLRALRYAHDDGSVDYYADKGDAMRKAFLRTPVNFTRISSRFNLKRKHPVLNKIRAHKGVDYAAPTGTPVKATGNGTVSLASRKGGYGRTVILRHGDKYSTLYAHLHRYAKGVRNGKRVKQGQVIGYVGSSGLATGPHLHYEFRVHGVHHNPLTVKLPKADSINQNHLEQFKQSITPMMAELDRLTGKQVLASKQPPVLEKIKIGMIEDG